MSSAPHPPSRGLRPALMAALVAGLVALAWAISALRPDTLVDRASPFGRVRVTEGWNGLRTLYLDGGRARQSALYPDRPLHLELTYTQVATIALALAPADGRLLYVGVGGGAMPRHARHARPRARIDAVDIHPVVVEVAQSHFGLRPDDLLALHTADGRAFIEAAPPAHWDVIVLDAFSDDAIPRALSTRQFLAAVRERLRPGGAVVSNVWTASPDYPAMLATYQAVFEQVRLLDVPGHAQRILLAADGTVALDREGLMAAARTLPADLTPGFDLPALVRQGWQAPAPAGAPVLEDAG